MSIRPAAPADVAALVELGLLMHAESPRFSRLPYDGRKVGNLLHTLLDSPLGFVRVLEINGAIVGVMVAAASESWFGAALTAFELVLFVAPDFRGTTAPLRLVAAYRDWARALGCQQITVGVSTGVHPESTQRLYEAAGAKLVGPILEFLPGEHHVHRA